MAVNLSMRSSGCNARPPRWRRRPRALTRAYNRATWIRFLLVFIPVPFVVLLLRLYLDARGYYVAGGVFIVCGAALFCSTAASAKCDAATQAAERARKALEAARMARDAAPR